MDLGQKLRLARQQAGLSQRQLCGSVITRNMLSQIENGSARPSMDTLRYLAGQLGKPLSYFLEEDAVVSPNPQCLSAARQHFLAGEYGLCLQQLRNYRQPDPVFDPEKGLLELECCLHLAGEAIAQGHLPHARQLLQQAQAADTPYRNADILRRTQLLSHAAGLLTAQEAAAGLPCDDDILLLRAEAALSSGDHSRCRVLLAATRQADSPRRRMLLADACIAAKDYPAALEALLPLEDPFPAQALPRMEVCYRELGDFENAYRCACRQRGNS